MPIRRRTRKTVARRRRSGKVSCGRVVTVNSAVVGEGRRMCRCGDVVSIVELVTVDAVVEQSDGENLYRKVIPLACENQHQIVVTSLFGGKVNASTK